MRKLIAGAIAGAVLIAGGAIAYASIPDSNGVIHACLKDGKIRVVDTDAGQSCSGSEQALNWNQQGPAGPPGGGVSIVNVVKHYTPSDPRLQPPTGAGHIYEELDCPTGKHAFNGGVRTTEPDSSAPQDAYPGNAQQVYGDQWTIEGSNGRFSGLPRPVNNDTAWRLPVALSLAYTQNPTTFYAVDVTYFVVCG
jgi:hypothetical protein